MVVTFGCQLLSRHFSTLMFISFLSNSLFGPMRWLTMWVNLFWTSVMYSPFCILKSSYSWIKACFLAFFTSFIPSCLTSSAFHISFALLHWETLKNTFILKDEVIIFFVLQSYWALPFFIRPFSSRLVHLFIFNKTSRSVWSINYCIPNPFFYRFDENLCSYFPKLIVYATKHRWPMNRGTFSKIGFILNHFKKSFYQTWISFWNGFIHQLFVLKWWFKPRRGKGWIGCLKLFQKHKTTFNWNK